MLTESEENRHSRVDIAFLQEALHECFTDFLL
jgi:hypothetical protein